MENNAPTAAGPTPDSEDNNNGSEKESPSPRIIESTTTENLTENDGVKDEQTTPDSAVNGVTNEASDDVTIESKPPEADDGTSKEEMESSELGKETSVNEQETREEKEEETQENKENNSRKADENQEDKQSEPDAETDVPVEKAEEGSESKVETESEEKTEVAEEGKVEVPLESVTENPTEPEPEVRGENGDKEKEEKTGTKQDFETNAEDKSDEFQEESQQEQVDTSSSVTKVEEGYSADNEATTTLASIDTGEPSQSGSVFEKDAKTDEVESTVIANENATVEKIGNEVEEKEMKEHEKEEPRMNYDELMTKYHATELQLDGLRDENKVLEDKVRDLERQIKEFNDGREQDKLKQRDGYMVQADFLARELSQTQDAEKFLKEKVAELLEEKEESEKKVRDLQLRLKRFSKDDKAKDERIAKMESELKEITEEVQELETYLDEETKVKIKAKRSSTRGSTVSAGNSHTKVTDINKMNTNRSHRDPEPVQRSRTCTII